MSEPEHFDIVVVGGGNAALCAALSAREAGGSVLVLERAPKIAAGGNTSFTGGGMRVPFRGLDDLLELMPELSQEDRENTDFGEYTEEMFFDDLARVTNYRADPDLAELLITRAFDTLKWMTTKGVHFIPSYGRQAFKIGGKQKFWGGSPLEVSGGGLGLVESLTKAVTEAGIEVRYSTRAVELVRTGKAVSGVIVEDEESRYEIAGSAVILGAGGFQANAEWRTRYLGPGWDLAKVRGTRYNTGDGIRMALEVGAMPWGHWSGCHAVSWDLNAPSFGDIRVGHGFNKHHYHLGVMLNADGQRFVDEGADIRNFTYAKYGRRVLEQPGQFAWQIFDSKVADLLQRDYYRIREVTRVTSDTLEGLVAKLEGVDPVRAMATLTAFNDAVQTDAPFDPTIKDGRATTGLELPKSNWAQRIDEGPFEAFAVTCGVTFTFGGLKVTTDGRVVDVEDRPIPGLFGCGELVGGLFYFNYPGGSGLTWGAVMGRAAGKSAAVLARDAGGGAPQSEFATTQNPSRR
jgi:tricarballylate dehydrogenase